LFGETGATVRFDDHLVELMSGNRKLVESEDNETDRLKASIMDRTGELIVKLVRDHRDLDAITDADLVVKDQLMAGSRIIMEVYDAMNTLLNMRVNLDDRVAVEAVEQQQC
jgi:hypothetical protein